MTTNTATKTKVTDTIIKTVICIVPNKIIEDTNTFTITWPDDPDAPTFTLDKVKMEITIKFEDKTYVIDALDPTMDIDHLPYPSDTVAPWELMDMVFNKLTNNFIDADLMRLRKEIDGQN